MLALEKSETTMDELAYLRVSRDRARLVMLTCRRLLADHEADDADVMVAVTQLRELVPRQATFARATTHSANGMNAYRAS
jgi:hypothetical protein